MARRLAACVGLGLLIGAPQLLATYLWIPETDRAIRGVLLRDAVAFSVSPLRLFEFLVPYPFGTTWKVDPAELWALPVFHGKGDRSLRDSLLRRIRRSRGGRLADRKAAPDGQRQQSRARSAAAGSAIPVAPPSRIARPRRPAEPRSVLAGRPSLPGGAALAREVRRGRLARDGADRRALFRAFSRRRAPRLVDAGSGRELSRSSPPSRRPLPGSRASIAELLTGVDAKSSARAAWLLPAALAEGGPPVDGHGDRGGPPAPRNTARASAAALAIVTLVPVAANRKIAQTYPQEDCSSGPTPIARLVRKQRPGGRVPRPGRSGLPAVGAGQAGVRDRLRRQRRVSPKLALLHAGALEVRRRPEHRLRQRQPLARREPAPALLRRGVLEPSAVLRKPVAEVGSPLPRPARAAGLPPLRRQRGAGLGRARHGASRHPPGRAMARTDRPGRGDGVDAEVSPTERSSSNPGGAPTARPGRERSGSSSEAPSACAWRPNARSDVALRPPRILDAPDGPARWPGALPTSPVAARLHRRFPFPRGAIGWTGRSVCREASSPDGGRSSTSSRSRRRRSSGAARPRAPFSARPAGRRRGSRRGALRRRTRRARPSSA